MSKNVINGKLTDISEGYIIHEVNNEGFMNKGVSLALKNKYLSHFTNYIEFLESFDYNVLGCMVHTEISDKLSILGLFIRDTDSKRDSDIAAIKVYMLECLEKVRKLYLKDTSKKFYMPYFIGTVRAGEGWNQMYKLIHRECPFITFVRYC